MSRWDAGIATVWTRVEDPTGLPLTVAAVRDLHLRSPNGEVEDDYIARLIETAAAAAEYATNRVLLPQTWTLTMNKFPSGAIELRYPPLTAVTEITYVDVDGVRQTLGGSPLPYEVINPGPRANRRACIVPAYHETWPTTRSQWDAVIVTFDCGYAEGELPSSIESGMLLMIGELYKQRSESVHAMNQNPSVIRARDLFRFARVESMAVEG